MATVIEVKPKALLWFARSMGGQESQPKHFFIKQHTRSGQRITRLFQYLPSGQTLNGFPYKCVCFADGIREAKSVAQSIYEKEILPDASQG